MKMISITIALIFFSFQAIAAERKPVTEVASESLMNDTTFYPAKSGDFDFAMAFWLPQEIWSNIFGKDSGMSEEVVDEMLGILSDISLLAVAQADITLFGSFDFYTKDEIAQGLEVSYTDAEGITRKLVQLESSHPDLEMIIIIFQQVFSGVMGNFGENLHVFVLNDREKTDGRLIDPYLDGSIYLSLTKRDQEKMESQIELPLNALFIPRKCPNGKDAHISWDYCPWTGVKLEE